MEERILKTRNCIEEIAKNSLNVITLVFCFLLYMKIIREANLILKAICLIMLIPDKLKGIYLFCCRGGIRSDTFVYLVDPFIDGFDINANKSHEQPRQKRFIFAKKITTIQ